MRKCTDCKWQISCSSWGLLRGLWNTQCNDTYAMALGAVCKHYDPKAADRSEFYVLPTVVCIKCNVFCAHEGKWPDVVYKCGECGRKITLQEFEGVDTPKQCQVPNCTNDAIPGKCICDYHWCGK